MQTHNPWFRNTGTIALLLAAAFSAAPRTASAQESEAPSPVADALARADKAVAAVIAIDDIKRNFDNTIGALDDLGVILRLDTDYVQFMTHVSTDADERDRGARAEQDVSNWAIALGKNEPLYRGVKAYADTQPRLEGEQARMLELTMRSFRRSGVRLSAEKREELKQVQMEITKLGIEFDKNIREDETRVPLTADELVGLPQEIIDNQPHSGDIYLVGMDYPTFLPLLDYCENETTRKKVWLAYKRRGGKKNIAVLEKMILARDKAAKLLGYENTAEYETEVRMAKNPQTVWDFYKKLTPLVRKKAERDWDEFVAAKRAHTADPTATLYPWDQPFYEKRLMKEKYAVDAQQVKEYFPMGSVVEGLFKITELLYGLEYRDATARAASKGRELWHQDVKLYEVFDKASGEHLGDFYLDLYPRDDKYGHAACWGLAPRKVWSDGRVTKPVAALVCNFTKPTKDKPSLLDHAEVKTFFHEFGHGLHQLLTEVHYGDLSGTAVARDFVEAPSQMFEHWIWDAEVLKLYARHYKTGEPLPDEMLQGMMKARNLGSGLKTLHQFYYGLTDFTYHTAPDGKVDTTKVGLDLYCEIELYDCIPGTYYQAAFGHLTGYQAAYYGYQWSLVYAEDMFQRFKERGMLNPEAGAYYRKKILSRGGTLEDMDMVKDYLGREPRLEPFLEYLGFND